MKNKLKYFFKNGKGASTVEFALTIGIFLAAVLSIFELARMSILSAYMDLTITQAVKLTKNSKASGYDYEREFEKNLNSIVNSIKDKHKSWKFLEFNDSNLIRFEVKYAETVDQLVNGQFKDVLDPKNPTKKIKDPGKDSALASYSFQYEYKPMFFWIPGAISKPIFNREVIILQEYERNKHQIR